MTAQKWSDAAKRYALPEPPIVRKDANLPVPQRTSAHGVAYDLETFICSEEGTAALALLRASKRHIIFGESREGGGYGSVWFINGTGFNRSDEPMGTWIAYTKDVPAPKITPVTALEVAQAAIAADRGNKKPEEIMTWLRTQIDRIADAAPVGLGEAK